MKRIHFVAIGGQGMSGIARILLEKGFEVTGSDLKPGTTTERLEKLGAKIFIGHRKENIVDPDLVVVSSAINPDNPEVKEAKARGVPVVHRMDMLLTAVGEKRLLAVAGAHGKTTTTSMIAWILEKAGKDPTYLVGGEFTTEGNAHLGSGDVAVVETDESDGSFLKAKPYLSVVTNIDNDHLDYWGSMDALENAFYTFLANTKEHKVVCAADVKLRNWSESHREAVTYAREDGATWTIRGLSLEGWGSRSRVFFHGKEVASLKLSVPGMHNVENALGAMAAAYFEGVDPDEASGHLLSFKGAKRRLERIGEFEGVLVLDDFAPHPREIRASLRAIRDALPGHRVLVIYQPHRYSRTKLLQTEFGPAFQEAHTVVMTSIYAGPGEAPEPSIDASLIAEALRRAGHPSVYYIPSMHEGSKVLAGLAREGDVIVTMGAGDIWKTHHDLEEALAGGSSRHKTQ